MFATAGSACLLIAAQLTVQVLVIAAWGMAYALLMRLIDCRAPRISGNPMDLQNERE
jgi:hypothetical protein